MQRDVRQRFLAPRLGLLLPRKLGLLGCRQLLVVLFVGVVLGREEEVGFVHA